MTPQDRDGEAWTVVRADRAASPVDVGATVYRCASYDYGCANDDTRMTGVQHVSVTLDPTGAYPFFTIPTEDLSPLRLAREGR